MRLILCGNCTVRGAVRSQLIYGSKLQQLVAVQDFLPVFAAGNEGFHGSNAEDGLKTVTSPATSKNCISAGATNTAFQIDTQATSSQYIVFQMSIIQQQSSGSQDVDQYKASHVTHSCFASARKSYIKICALKVMVWLAYLKELSIHRICFACL